MSFDSPEQTKYRHYIPTCPENPDFRSNYIYHLVETIEDLREILPKKPGLFAFDLETSGLSQETSFIVGVCMCFDGKTGYYVPINHVDNSGLGFEALEIIYEALLKAQVVITFNLKFDFRHMEYAKYYWLKNGGSDTFGQTLRPNTLPGGFNAPESPVDMSTLKREDYGYDMSPVRYYDVQSGMYLADTNVRFPTLKGSELHYLGWVAPHFEDALGGGSNFYFTTVWQEVRTAAYAELEREDVEKMLDSGELQRSDVYGREYSSSVVYAITDALGTFELFEWALSFTKESGKSGKLDIDFLYPLMRLEENLTPVNVDLISTTSKEIKDRSDKLLVEIWDLSGFTWQPTSPKQFSEFLEKMGIDTGVRTAKGAMSTDKSLIEKVASQHEVLPIVQEYLKLKKVNSAYLNPMLIEAGKKDGYLRSSYQLYSAPTCRLAGGKDSKNEFSSAFNIHAVPKPRSLPHYAKKTGATHKDAYFGWEFSPDPNFSDLQVEGFDQHANIRRCITPHKDTQEWMWVSIDYSGQEIFLAAVDSGEEAWLNDIVEEKDVHVRTAHIIWGKENYDKGKRRKAKEVNFGSLYGQAAKGFSEKWNVPIEQAKEDLDKFWAGLPGLNSWRRSLEAEGRTRGTVYNMFGRARRVKWYLTHENKSMKAFGYRTCTNTAIQSAGADVLKMAMIKLWYNVFQNPLYMGDVEFLNTVHDEINFRVRRSRALEIIEVLSREMRIYQKGWPIPMRVGISVGDSWGNQFDFKHDKEGNFVPKFEKLSDEDWEKAKSDWSKEMDWVEPEELFFPDYLS